MPVVVGLLGREVRERGLDAAGLVNLLRGEREPVEGARPAELADRPIHRRDWKHPESLRWRHRHGRGPGSGCCYRCWVSSHLGFGMPIGLPKPP